MRSEGAREGGRSECGKVKRNGSVSWSRSEKRRHRLNSVSRGGRRGSGAVGEWVRGPREGTGNGNVYVKKQVKICPLARHYTSVAKTEKQTPV